MEMYLFQVTATIFDGFHIETETVRFHPIVLIIGVHCTTVRISPSIKGEANARSIVFQLALLVGHVRTIRNRFHMNEFSLILI